MSQLTALEDVYWIGGGPAAGKSTVARDLADRYGLRLYPTDDVMAAHAARSTRADSPYLHEFLAMDADQRWLRQSPEAMLETFHWFRGEGFGFIVDDLRGLPPGPPVVVEGFRLLPHLVRPLLATPRQAVWLLPTPDFYRFAHERRGSTWRLAGQTGDPERARENLRIRDEMFVARLRAEAAPIIEVDATMTEDDLTGRVAEGFGLTPAPPGGPAPG
jgi:hypothetical protein